jgi:hypothetical protein
MLKLNLSYLNIAVGETLGMMYSEQLRSPSDEEHLEGVSELMQFLQRYQITRTG